MTFAELLAGLTGNPVFLATVSAAGLTTLFAFLANRGITLAEQDRELVTTGTPVVIAGVAYGVGAFLGQFPFTLEAAFPVVLTVLAVLGGRAVFQAGAQKVQAVRAAQSA